jgi:hypothetical protein
MLYKSMINIILFLSSIAIFGQPVTGKDYLAILKRGYKYDSHEKREIPNFTYQSSRDSDLFALRQKYNLDSVAGFGNETSRLLNLLHWVHNKVPHNGLNESGIKNVNANSILTAVMTRHIGVSCGELATTLNDCYLAMGWESRKVYCFPKDSLGNDTDSHVINIVYLASKNKWIWVDPTNDAYIMDEKGDLLSIEEVRERLIANKPLIVNPDAIWNRRISMTKDYYLDSYMAKNLYRVYCPLKSEYDYETSGGNKSLIYINLIPLDYLNKLPFKTEKYYPDLKTTFIHYYISDPKLFWKLPNHD